MEPARRIYFAVAVPIIVFVLLLGLTGDPTWPAIIVGAACIGWIVFALVRDLSRSDQ